MSLFMPSFVTNRVSDITLDFIKEFSIKAVVLDIDNTIAAPESNQFFDGVLDFINMLKENNIKVILCSNNFKSRVIPIAEKLDVPFISLSMKPFGLGVLRTKFKIKEKSCHILLVGDQVFTDIIAANLWGMKSILVKPQIDNDPYGVKIKRKFEDKIRKKAKRLEESFLCTKPRKKF